MSDTSEPNSDEKAKGFFLTTHGISCIPCKCKKQFYHKESKTVKEGEKVTTNTVEDRRNLNLAEETRAPTKYLNQKINYRQGVLKNARLDGVQVEDQHPKKTKKGYLD